MLFSALQLLKYLFLMGTVLFGTTLLKKCKLSELARKIANVAILLLAMAFFSIPFQELLTFRSADTAFSATVLGDKLADAEGDDSYGAFFRDPRGTYSTVFFYKKDGKYYNCPSENRVLEMSVEEHGVYIDLYCIASTADCYVIIRGYDLDALMVQDTDGTSFRLHQLQTSQDLLTYTMAYVEYCSTDLSSGEEKLYVNEIVIDPTNYEASNS